MKNLLLILSILFAQVTLANNVISVDINIKDHQFEPNRLELPSGQKIRLIVHNLDDTIEEFESFDLKREKIVPPGGGVIIVLAPLAPGEYTFFGDFHQDTARGVIVIK